MPNKPLTSLERELLDDIVYEQELAKVRDASGKPKPLAYDPKCQSLAEDFLDDHRPFTEAEAQDLAQTIQDAIEDWFAARENHLEGHE